MGLLDDAIREHLELKRKHGANEDELERAEREALTPARRDPNAGAGVPPIEQVPGAEGEAPLVDEPPPTQPAATDKPPPPDLDAPPPEPEPEPVIDQPTAIRAVPPVDVDEPAYADEDLDEDDAPHGAVRLDDDLDPDAAPAPSLPPVEYDEEDDYLAPEPADGPAAHPPLESTAPIEAPELDHLQGESPEPETAPDPSFDEPDDEALAPPESDDRYRARTSILDDPLSEDPPPPAAETADDGEQDVLEETPDFLQETPEHDKLWFEQKPPRDFDFD